MIPVACTVCVCRRDGRLRRYRIPLSPLWPFIVALFSLLEMPVLFGCTALLFVRPRDTARIALALPATLYLLSQAAGLSVEFAGQGRSEVLVLLS